MEKTSEDDLLTIAERLPLVAGSARRTLELVSGPERLPDASLRWMNPSRTLIIHREGGSLPTLGTLRLHVMSPGLAATIVVDDLAPDSPMLSDADPASVVEEALRAAAISMDARGTQADFVDDAYRIALRLGAEMHLPDQDWIVAAGSPVHGCGQVWSIDDGSQRLTLRATPPAEPLVALHAGSGTRLHADEISRDHRGRPVPYVLMRIARLSLRLTLSDLEPIQALRLLADQGRKAA